MSDIKVILYECGICDSLHPWDWDGDCREDRNRYGTAEEYCERHGNKVLEIEVRSWEDRQAADVAGLETAPASPEQLVWAEMARRKRQFHDAEPWQNIRLWGLFPWGMVADLIRAGRLLTDMRPENEIVWVWPSEEAYHAHIEPLLSLSVKELTAKAGWGVS